MPPQGLKSGLVLAKEPAKVDPKRETEATYSEEFPVDWAGAQEILVKYSGVPEQEIEKHVRDVRSEAFAVHPYVCVGRFRFLQLSISQHMLYGEVFQRLQSEKDCILFDMGCCFAQDLRRLVYDGVSSDQLLGADLRLDFLELGHRLFRDQERFPRTQFFEGDVFAASGTSGEKDLARLDGKVNIVHAASFLHLFDWDDQVTACCRTVRFFKASEQNALIFGRQVGSVNPGNYLGRSGDGARFRHDARTFQELWNVVGQATQSKWRVAAELATLSFDGTPIPADHTGRKLEFAVHRVG